MKFKTSISIFFLILSLFAINKNLFAGYYEEGCKYYNAKKYDKAREMFLKSIETSDYANSYYFLGDIERNENNFDKAIEYYRSAIEKNLNNKYKKLAYWNMIVIEEQKGDYNEMVIICKELWDKMADEGAKKKVEALISKMLWTDNDEAKEYYKNGQDYKEKKMSDKARESFTNALRIDSGFLAPKFELGLMQYNDDNPNQASQASQAVNYFTDIIEKIPFYGEVHLLLADIYYTRQSYKKSAEHFINAIDYSFLDNQTKYAIYLKAGTSFYEAGDIDKSIEIFTNASDLNKKETEPLLMLSAIYIRKGELDKAVSPLLKAKELNQNNPEIIFQIGSLYYKLNDQEYVQYYSALFNKYSSSKDTIPQKYFKAFIILMKNYYENKKYDNAAKIAEILPDSMKNNETNLISARIFSHTGKYEKSIEYFEKLSLNNDDKYLLCVSYAKTGMTAKSREILVNLLELPEYKDKAAADNAVKKIVLEIENEKNNTLLEEKKKEEMRLLEEKQNEDKPKEEENVDKINDQNQ